MLISVAIQMMYHKKFVKDPHGNTLGLEPTNSKSVSRNPIIMAIGMLALTMVSTGMLYLDSGLASINHIGFTVNGFEIGTALFTNLVFLLVASIATIAIIIFTDKSLSKIEKSKVMVIFTVSFFVIFFGVHLNRQVLHLPFLQMNKRSEILDSSLYLQAFFNH